MSSVDYESGGKHVPKWAIQVPHRLPDYKGQLMVLITPDCNVLDAETRGMLQVEYFHEKRDPMGVSYWEQCDNLGSNNERNILASALLQRAIGNGTAVLAVNPTGE